MQKTQKYISKVATLFVLIFLLGTACNKKNSYKQPVLGNRSVALIEIDGYQFKDLNKNGKLDKYEDWRLEISDRVADLQSQMTLEEKVGFMLISTINMGGPPPKITSDFSEEETLMENNFFTRKPLAMPALFVSGTTKGVTERNLRHFILRANTDAKTIAEWHNKLQALTESTRLYLNLMMELVINE